MNFIGKSTGGDSGSSTSSRRQQQGGDGVEEDDDEERQNIGPAGQLHHSSPSSSPSSSHHPHQNLNHHQPPYHHHNLHGGWMHGGGGGEPSSSHQTLPIPPAPDDDINTNNDEQQSGSGMMMVVEREHMFDKVVTPSDVGKLNRLVIPKQHAERYFPLDSSTNDKGLLLNFEDRNGKSWRFRYSYWNSSQSYVMTKGWSRFVKDKKLDAGDIVSFQRGVRGSVKDRLFIDWRHRPDAPAPPYHFTPNLPFPHHQFSLTRSNIQHHHHPWNPLFLQSQPAARTHPDLIHQPSSYRYGTTGGGGPYHNVGTGSIVNVNQGGSGSVIYFRSGGGGGGGIPPQYVDMNQRSGVGLSAMDPVAAPPPSLPPPSTAVFESVPVVHGKAAAKRLRLFGVNMDCPISDEDGPAGESPTIGNYHHDQFYHHHVPPSTPSSSTIPYQQLKPYEEETEFHQTSNSSSSPMSLDLGI